VNSLRSYEEAITETNALIDDLQRHVPAAAVDRSELVVTDLDKDHHRMDCTDTTSQYKNFANIWLNAGSDPVSYIDAMREALYEADWNRVDSVEEMETGTQGTEGSYTQIMVSPDGFTAMLSKWKDGEQDGVQAHVMSPCVANPVGKHDTWGR
jgi:hypothetical protein